MRSGRRLVRSLLHRTLWIGCLLGGGLLAAAFRGAGTVAAGDSPRGDCEVLLHGKSAMSVRAAQADLDAARAAAAGAAGDLLWIRRDGRVYLVRDAATLDAASQLFTRQADLGRQQKELGERQTQIGREQRLLGAEQKTAGALQSAAASPRRIDRAPGEPDELSDPPGPAGAAQRELRSKQAGLAVLQAADDGEQRRLAALQDDLARQQRDLESGLGDRFRQLADAAVGRGAGAAGSRAPQP